jgi:3-hydroxypropanoate dehydrogenase
VTIDTFALPAAVNDETADLLFREARSVETFGTDPVPDAQLAAAWDLAKWGPTSMNITPLRVLVVRSPEARERLAVHVNPGNRDRVLAAPVSLVLAADTRFHEHLPRLAPHRTAMVPGLEAAPERREAMARNNAWLGAGYLIVALRGVGLAVGPMGGMDTVGLDDDLLAGTGWRSFLVLNVGQASSSQAHHPRAPRLTYDEATRTL